MTKKIATYTLDGTLCEPGDISHWMADSMLKEALGDYITNKDIYKRIVIKYTKLRSSRKSGKIRAKKVGGTWFYSKQDLLNLIKASKV